MKRLKWTIWVVLALGSLDMAFSQVVEDNPAFFTAPPTCTTTADCANNANAICAIATGGTTGQCKCDGDNGWLKIKNACVVLVGLKQKCNKVKSVCSTQFSSCSPAGLNDGSYFCKCIDGYLAVTRGVPTPQCFKIVTSRTDPRCTTCEGNQGTCYLDSAGLNKCFCPTSRTGTECATIHTNVTCDTNTFEMQVCYDPHPWVDFAKGSKLYTYMHGNDVACTAKMEDGTGTCKAGSYRLTLPMDSQHQGRCGTREVMQNPSERTFKVTLTVDLPLGVKEEVPVFDAFCTYTIKTDNTFSGIGVLGLPGNDRGQFKTPDLKFSVLSQWHDPISSDVAMSLYDKFFFQVELTNDGTYTAIFVEQCTVSTSPIMPDPKAITKVLVEKGCPAVDQDIFNATNNWRLIDNLKNKVKTGMLKMFKLPVGRTIFMHCRFDLCLKGNEDDCAQPVCTPPGGTGGGNTLPNNPTARKKRAATYRDAEITRALHWYDPDDKQNTVAELKAENNVVVMNTVGFAVLLTILALMLIVFMVLSVLLFFRQRPKPYAIDDHIPEKPQRFALPRIARNNMRV